MLSSRFAGIPISSSIIDEAGVAAVAEPRGANGEAVTGSGGRLHFGMVAGIKSERWPTSNRNPRPDCLGIRRPLHLVVRETEFCRLTGRRPKASKGGNRGSERRWRRGALAARGAALCGFGD